MRRVVCESFQFIWMRVDPKRAWISPLLVAGILGCGPRELPHENGVRWDCVGEAFDSSGQLIGRMPIDFRVQKCADINVDPSVLADNCKSNCEKAIRRYGFFPEPPFFWQSGRCDVVPGFAVPNDTERCNESSVVDVGGGPALGQVFVSGDEVLTLDCCGSAPGSVFGFVDYQFQTCSDGPCQFEFTRFDLFSSDFRLDDKPLDQIFVILNNRPAGQIFPDGTFTIPAGALRLAVNFRLDGDAASKMVISDMPLSGQLSIAANTFSIDPLTISVDSTLRLSVNLAGIHTNRPPHASFTPLGTIECNAPQSALVILDGSTSTDPDSNIGRYNWYLGSTRLGGGQTLGVVLPFGQSSVSLEVFDTKIAGDVEKHDLTVTDTTAPALTPPPDLFQESCDPLGAAVDPGKPTVVDACDLAPAVTATITDINGLAESIPLTPGFVFPQGTTVITYVATDAVGNKSTATQTISIDRGASCCPAGTHVITGTPGNDLLSGTNRRDCLVGLAGDDTIAGGNQADVIFGGPGADRCSGGNGADTAIYGGIGNDILDGTNGHDLLLSGGPGDDVIYGGAGPDRIRGGAGADKQYGADGNDVFVIAAACEAQQGEVIDGGNGIDRIESPLTAAELRARGVTIVNVEEFVLTAPLADAECR